MAITAEVTLKILARNEIGFEGKEGPVRYTEIIADHDGDLVVLRAQDETKFLGFEPGEVLDVTVESDGRANLRVEKYKLVI